MRAMRGVFLPSSVCVCGMTSLSTGAFSCRVPWLSCHPKKARNTMSSSSDGGSLKDLRSMMAVLQLAEERRSGGTVATSAMGGTYSHKAV
jgi:hypothetical protein